MPPIPARLSTPPRAKRVWVERLQLTNFRNYREPVAERRPRPRRAHRRQRLGQDQPAGGRLAADVGPGAAPRALSRACPHGRRRAGRWRPASTRRSGPLDIGTGLAEGPDADGRPGRSSGRIVRIDGETQSGSGALADHVEMVWLIPAMDGLFTGPASDRRRFLDRLIACLASELPLPARAVRAGDAAAQPAAGGRRARRRPLRGVRADHGRGRRRHRRRPRRGRRRARGRDRRAPRRRRRRALPVGGACPRRHARGGARDAARHRGRGRLLRGCWAASASATGPRAARWTGPTAPISRSDTAPRRCPPRCARRASRRPC